jgi:hypothetical protein
MHVELEMLFGINQTTIIIIIFFLSEDRKSTTKEKRQPVFLLFASLASGKIAEAFLA